MTKENRVPIDVNVPCPCGCGIPIGNAVEFINGEWRILPITAEDLENLAKIVRSNPHPKKENIND